MSHLQKRILHVHPAECTPQMLMDAFVREGAVLFTGALPGEVVERAFADAGAALGETGGYVEWQQFNPHTRTGYTAAGIEKAPGEGVNWDRHFFDYRPDFVALYPSPCIDSLRPLHCHLTGLGEKLCILLDRAADLSLYSVIQNGPHILRVAECLNNGVDPEQELFGSHVDFGLLTFFVGGAIPGLQIHSKQEWVDADPGKGDVLVGAGTILKQYHPAFRSLRHRVVARSVRRLSLFQFIEPRTDVRLPNNELAGEFFTRVLKGVRKDA